MEELELKWQSTFEVVSLQMDRKKVRSLPACVIYPRADMEE
ncbi:MAG: hypothetical protein V3U09_07225 [Thermoplasmata archaeon]